MTITKIFVVDEQGNIVRLISVENCATKFCGSCIIKRFSNNLFDTKMEFDLTVENCVMANDDVEIREKCEAAHFTFFL